MKLSDYKKSLGKDKRYVIGIDAGKHTGIAWFDRQEQKFFNIHTSDFWTVIDDFRDKWRFEVVFVIENPNAHRRKVFGRLDGVQGEARARVAENIGANRREASLLIEKLESLGYQVIQVKPTTAKWDAETLKRKTGITQRTSEHARDAVKLVVENGF